MLSLGQIRVNGDKIASLGVIIDPENDIVEVNGIKVQPKGEKTYFLLNKTAGYVSTTSDERGRKTILDLLPSTNERLYPVGRLDIDTEGLIIITNDGELTYLLTHPKHNINKVYLAWLDGRPTINDIDKLSKGVMLEDGMTAPALVERENYSKGDCLRITIHEGRKRQVRRMCEAIGYKVLKLRRVKIGFLELGKIPLGKFRRLLPEEVEALKKLAEYGLNTNENR